MARDGGTAPRTCPPVIRCRIAGGTPQRRTVGRSLELVWGRETRPHLRHPTTEWWSPYRSSSATCSKSATAHTGQTVSSVSYSPRASFDLILSRTRCCSRSRSTSGVPCIDDVLITLQKNETLLTKYVVVNLIHTFDRENCRSKTTVGRERDRRSPSAADSYVIHVRRRFANLCSLARQNCTRYAIHTICTSDTI